MVLPPSANAVPADRLIDELWGEDSPEDATAALRVNVSRLRELEALVAEHPLRERLRR